MMRMNSDEGDDGSCGRDSFLTSSMVEADEREREKGKKGEPPPRFE